MQYDQFVKHIVKEINAADSTRELISLLSTTSRNLIDSKFSPEQTRALWRDVSDSIRSGREKNIKKGIHSSETSKARITRALDAIDSLLSKDLL